MSNAASVFSHYEDLISLRMLSPGRVIFACDQTLGIIKDLRDAAASTAATPLSDEQTKTFNAVEARILETRTQAQAALKVDGERQTILAAAKLAVPIPSLKLTDNLADSLLGGFHRGCKQTVRDFPAGHARHTAATALLVGLFPQGIRAITHIAAVDQLAQMHRILEACATDLQAHIQTLSLSDLLDRLKSVTHDYALALQPLPTTPYISGAQVIDAKREANVLLRRAVAVVLGRLEDPSQTPLRDKLLAPVLKQNQAAYVAQQTHKVSTDIDPTTGIELPPELP